MSPVPSSHWSLPDFGTYPTEHLVVDATCIDHGVALKWTDGVFTHHHRFVLRENSPDPATTHPLSREQQLQLTDMHPDLQITAAEPDQHGGLVVSWSHGTPTTSTYHPGWLRAWAARPWPSKGSPTAGSSLPGQVLWRASLGLDAITFEPEVLAGDAELVSFATTLYTHGVALVRGLPVRASMVTELPSLIGPVRATNFGEVFDVRTKAAEVTSNAYTDLELPVHVDLATREYMPGLQFLFCMTNDASGGESRLCDAAAIAALLRDEHPDAFNALTTIEVGFANKAADTDYRHRGPFLVVDCDGELIEARWSPWLRAPLQAPLAEADRFYRALRLAMSLAEDRQFIVAHRLEPGDMLAFDNRRVLHGRGAVDRSTGDRWLRGSYVEREELASLLRVRQR